MGIKGRFIKAECAVLAASIMLAPFALCGCDTGKEAPTESATETVPSETAFIPTPFPTKAKVTEQEAEAEAVRLAEKCGLTKDDLRGKYTFFLRYYDAVFTNMQAWEYRNFLMKFYPMVADHVKSDKEEFFLAKINSLKMETVKTDAFAGGFSGNEIMFNSNITTWGDYFPLVVYHETTHFIDAFIDGDVGEVYIMNDGSFQFHPHIEEGGLDMTNVVYHSNIGYFTEGGAEKYKTEYFTKASTDPTPTGLEFLVGLEYIFGKETVDDMFFSHDTALKFCNLLKENGFSNDEIIRMLRTSVTDEVMTDETQYIDPREVLIRLYKTKKGSDYENDAQFCAIIASLDKALINKIPTEYRDFITKVTKSAAKSRKGLEKQVKKAMGTKQDVYFEAVPYTFFIDGELKLVTMATTYEKGLPVYTSVVFDYDFEKGTVIKTNVSRDYIPAAIKVNPEEDLENMRAHTADNSAAHNQTVNGNDPYMTEIYKKAEEIGNKYGIYFWFDDLIPEAILSDPYKEPAKDPILLSKTLDSIEEVLKLYPEGYFDQFLFGGNYNGVGICILNEEIPDYSSDHSVNINGYKYMVIYIAMKFDNSALAISRYMGEQNIKLEFPEASLVQARLICDIWVMTNEYLKKYNACFNEPPVSDEAWQALNYKGFKYLNGGGTEQVYDYVANEKINMDYFILKDSVHSIETDRFITYQYLMLSALTGKKPLTLTDEQKAKAQELCSGLRKSFDTSKWPDQTSWEKAI